MPRRTDQRHVRVFNLEIISKMAVVGLVHSTNRRSRHVYLIRVETKAGHGGSSLTKRIEENTDIYSFMFYNMNFPIEATAVKR